MRLINKKQLAVKEVASTDKTRYALNGVKIEEIEIDGKSGVRTVATNGRVLAMVESINPPTDEFPTMTELNNAPNGKSAGIIPTKSVERMIASIPKSKKLLPALSNGILKIGENEATFIATDLFDKFVVPTRLIEGTYPNYEQTIPKGDAQFKVVLDPALLISLLRVATVALDGHPVTLHFYDELSAVKLTGQNRDDKLTGLIMPMKP